MDIKKLYDILLSEKPSEEIKNNEKKIFKLIPELEVCKGFNQNNPWHVYDVYDHTMHVVDNVDNNIIIRMAALFHDIGKPNTYTEDENKIGHFYGHYIESVKIFDAFSKRNNLNEDIVSSVKKLIFYHDKNIGKCNDEELKELSNIFTLDEIRMLFQLKKADLLAQNKKYHYILENYEVEEKELLKKKEHFTR